MEKKHNNNLKYLTISQLTKQGLQTLSVLILARLIMPFEFGQYTMIIVIIGFLGVISETGLNYYIINNYNKNRENELDSIFMFNILIGIIILSIVGFSPTAIYIYIGLTVSSKLYLVLLSINIIIQNSAIVQRGLLEKDSEFLKISIVEIVAAIIAFIIAIIIAIFNGGIWSLIIQVLIINSITLIGLSYYSRWFPKIQSISRGSFSYIKYGLSLSGFNFTNYILRNGDNYVVGKYLGHESLGYYNTGYRLTTLPGQIIASILSKNCYPKLAILNREDDDIGFHNTYLNLQREILYLSIPVFVIQTVYAKELVYILLGPNWSVAGEILPYLTLVGLIQSVDTTTGMIFTIKNKTGLLFIWGLIVSFVMMTSFLIGKEYGLFGVVYSLLISTIVTSLLGMVISLRIAKIKTFDYIVKIWKPILINIILFIYLICSHVIIGIYSNNSTLLTIIFISIGILVYFRYWIRRDSER